MQFIERVNKNLNQAVSIAEKDYTAINAVLKSCYENKEQRALAEVESTLKTLIVSLQYMDIFKQRVEHLVSTHNQLIPDGLNSDFKKSLIHLHVFQALTIELDLLQSISTIQSMLTEIKNQFIEAQQAPCEINEALFCNTSIIKETLHKTVVELLQAGGETKNLPIPALTADQIHVLNSLYTMESERIVLTWFLDSMPSGTWEELMQRYQEVINEVVNQTELF